MNLLILFNLWKTIVLYGEGLIYDGEELKVRFNEGFNCWN
nr:hypothetical protein CJLB15_00084 [Campylobacter phage CJLB-15]